MISFLYLKSGWSSRKAYYFTAITNISHLWNSIIIITRRKEGKKKKKKTKKIEKSLRFVWFNREHRWSNPFFFLLIMNLKKKKVQNKKWINAMDEEITEIKKNDTWELKMLSHGNHAISVKWVYIKWKGMQEKRWRDIKHIGSQRLHTIGQVWKLYEW